MRTDKTDFLSVALFCFFVFVLYSVRENKKRFTSYLKQNRKEKEKDKEKELERKTEFFFF